MVIQVAHFLNFVHRLSIPVGTSNLSILVNKQPTTHTLGVDFCVYDPFCYPIIKIAMLQLQEVNTNSSSSFRLLVTIYS